MAETHRGFFAWLQDNARILLSIALVLFLLFAVYSYSKRADQASLGANDTQSEISDTDGDNLTLDENIADIASGDGTDLIGAGGGPEDSDTLVGTETPTDTDTAMKDKAEPKIEKQVMEQKAMKKEGEIVVSAGNGDGMTHLARRATAEYIQTNKIDYLNAAQKVYIEDYLRKQHPATLVHPGTSANFSNDAIATAVQRAQDLSEAQLANLAHYAKNVSAFQ